MASAYIDREKDPDYEEIEELIRNKTAEQLDKEFDEWKRKFMEEHEQFDGMQTDA